VVHVDCGSWDGMDELLDRDAYNAHACAMPTHLDPLEAAYWNTVVRQFLASPNEQLVVVLQVVRYLGGPESKNELHAMVLTLHKDIGKDKRPLLRAQLFDPADGKAEHAQWKKSKTRFWKADCC